ncbi:hypothetical protein BST86_03175 [Nonlabens agnitus]|uniref:Uncharacterized protein n=1 Tax=Nonlabens agnitus TaxID=870484 RepID=A0A2S9WRP9_9FLAO|nr:hypothetical protein BST86_03175 [Nonlabens agnitus]
MSSRIFIKCEDAHVLSTRDQYKDLNPKERFRLNLHKSHCPGCRKFHKINDKFSSKMKSLKWVKLSDEQKKSIKERLKEHISN